MLANFDRKWAWSFSLRVWDFPPVAVHLQSPLPAPVLVLGWNSVLFIPGKTNGRFSPPWWLLRLHGLSWALVGDVINLQPSHSHVSSSLLERELSNHHTAACTSHTLLSHTRTSLSSGTTGKQSFSWFWFCICASGRPWWGWRGALLMVWKWNGQTDGSSVGIDTHTHAQMKRRPTGQQLGWLFRRTTGSSGWKWCRGRHDHLFMCEWVRPMPKHQPDAIPAFFSSSGWKKKNQKPGWARDFKFCLSFFFVVFNWKWDHLSVAYLKLTSDSKSIIYLRCLNEREKKKRF